MCTPYIVLMSSSNSFLHSASILEYLIHPNLSSLVCIFVEDCALWKITIALNWTLGLPSIKKINDTCGRLQLAFNKLVFKLTTYTKNKDPFKSQMLPDKNLSARYGISLFQFLVRGNLETHKVIQNTDITKRHSHTANSLILLPFESFCTLFCSVPWVLDMCVCVVDISVRTSLHFWMVVCYNGLCLLQTEVATMRRKDYTFVFIM